MMQKKSFILHIDSLQILSEISDDLAGRLIKAIANYHLTGEEPAESDLRFLFLPFKYQFVRDAEKYGSAADLLLLSQFLSKKPSKLSVKITSAC